MSVYIKLPLSTLVKITSICFVYCHGYSKFGSCSLGRVGGGGGGGGGGGLLELCLNHFIPVGPIHTDLVAP